MAFDEAAFLARARDPGRVRAPLTSAQFMEVVIRKFESRAKEDQKVALAEMAAILGARNSGDLAAMMDNPEMIVGALRRHPSVAEPFCIHGCMKTAPVRLTMCETCGWEKILCIACADKKDHVYGITTDDKLLWFHAIVAGHDVILPVRACTACGRKNRLRAGVVGAKCGDCGQRMDLS